MLTWKLAWRNLFRNRRRTLTAVVTIGGAVFLSMTFTNIQAGSFGRMIDEATRIASGHIGFYRSGYLGERKTALHFPAAPILAALVKIPGVAEVYPRQYVTGLVRSSREGRPVTAMGVDFAAEMRHNPLLAEKRMVEGSTALLLHASRIPLAVIGADLARELGVKAGGKLVFMAQNDAGQIERRLLGVAAVVRSHIPEMDAGAVFVARETLDAFTAPGAAHEIGVVLTQGSALDAMLTQLSALAATVPQVEALPWNVAMPDLMNSIKYKVGGSKVVAAVLYFLVALGTANLLAMGVMERTREFGMVRALGLNARRVRRAVFAEAGLLGLAGVVAGSLTALPLCAWVKGHGISLAALTPETEFGGTLFEPFLTSAWDLAGMLHIGLLMMGVVFLSSLYPAHLALRIAPSEAMRKP